MTRLRPATAAALLLLALTLTASCGAEESPEAATPTRPDTATAGTPAPQTSRAAQPMTLEDGLHPARLRAVDLVPRTVTVDVVQFLTGDAAASAAAEDGGEVPPPNDYWVRNDNDLLRTLPVDDDARVVTNTLTAAETGDATEDVEVTLDRLAELPGLERALFWLTVADGTVVELEEQYLP